jgi:four helix bundle protein
MPVSKFDIMKRLKALAVNTAKLCLRLPNNIINRVYIGQIIRCSSSPCANYRAACRGKSKPDFINKLRIVEEELDETMLFLELLAEFNHDFKNELRTLYVESNELLSIIVSSINTTLKNIADTKQKSKNPIERK